VSHYGGHRRAETIGGSRSIDRGIGITLILQVDNLSSVYEFACREKLEVLSEPLDESTGTAFSFSSIPLATSGKSASRFQHTPHIDKGERLAYRPGGVEPLLPMAARIMIEGNRAASPSNRQSIKHRFDCARRISLQPVIHKNVSGLLRLPGWFRNSSHGSRATRGRDILGPVRGHSVLQPPSGQRPEYPVRRWASLVPQIDPGCGDVPSHGDQS
jgi:hypothetical protein